MTDREMLGAEFVVCLPTAPGFMFPDNVRAVCCHCGRAIQHRPSVPRTVRKICTDCATVAYDTRDGDVELKITKEQRRDLAELLKRKQH